MAKCDVQGLLNSAACFQCLTPGEQDLLETALLCSFLTNANNSTNVKTFVSTIFALGNIPSGPGVGGTYYAIAHGLGSTPQVAGAYLQCVTNDTVLNVGVGGIIPIEGILDEGNGGPAATVYADSTNIYFSASNMISGQEVVFQLNANSVGGWLPGLGIAPFSDFTKYRLVVTGILF
jgi:hypothetical protein